MTCGQAVLCGALLMLGTTVVPTRARAQDTQSSIRGVVLSAQGTPLALASVGIAALGRSTTSDSMGRFRLGGVRFGSHLVEARAIGYRPAWQSVTILPGDSATLEFRLKAAVVTLPEVVVSTSREEQLASSTPLSVGVIREEEIRETRGHHPSELVNRSPGVYVSNFGGEGHATAIRQPITTKALYAYLEDGVPIRSTGFFNHNALYEINIPQAGRLEIIKGPGTAVYGSDAVGGVINSFTREPTAQSEAELFVEGGSSRYVRGLGSASTPSGELGCGWMPTSPGRMGGATILPTIARAAPCGGTIISATALASRPCGSLSYRSTGRRRQRSHRHGLPDRALPELHPDRVSPGVGDSALVGVPGTDGAIVLPGDAVCAVQQHGLLPSWQLSFDPQTWESRNYSIGLLTHYRRTLPQLRTNFSTGVDLEYSPGSRLETEIQPQRAGQVFTAYTTGEVQYDYDVSFWQASPYAQADVSLPGRVQLSAGARYDQPGYEYDNRLSVLETGSHRRPASTGVGFNRLSPKLGATWEIAPSASVFASYREAFRAPSESQLFRQGSAENTVDLKPVRAANGKPVSGRHSPGW